MILISFLAALTAIGAFLKNTYWYYQYHFTIYVYGNGWNFIRRQRRQYLADRLYFDWVNRFPGLYNGRRIFVCFAAVVRLFIGTYPGGFYYRAHVSR